MRTGRITAPDGVGLHYRLVGDHGPLLLLLQGGLSDADVTAALADRLATDHRVLAHDRAGIGRSDDRPHPAADPLAEHAADALALLDALAGADEVHGGAGVVVVGVSVGAVIALHLALLAPERVRVVVAHEPPLPRVVADPERAAALQEVARLAAEQGPFAAGQAMGELTAGGDGREPDAPAPTPAGDLRHDLERFFRVEFEAVRACTLTATDLGPVRDRLHFTGGTSSRGRWEHRCAATLADELGAPFAELPGGHGAPATHPRGVAEALRALLSGR